MVNGWICWTSVETDSHLFKSRNQVSDHSRHKTVDKYRTVDITTMECFGIGTRILEEKKSHTKENIYTVLRTGLIHTTEGSAKEEKVSAVPTREDHCQGGAQENLGIKGHVKEGHMAHELLRALQSHSSINNSNKHLLSYLHISNINCTINIPIP